MQLGQSMEDSAKGADSILELSTVTPCSLPKNIFPLFFQAQWSRPLEFRSTLFSLLSLKPIFERSKPESLGDVSITRIGDTLSYGFLQIACTLKDFKR